ncbi:glycine betaine ABC transporter substrate-binding protein [Bacillus sp. FSL H8-0547]
MKKKIWTAFILLLIFTVTTACGSSSSSIEKDETITVGTKYHTESYLLSKITALYLKDKGYKVEEAGQMGGQLSRQALEKNQIDLYWDYTGTALVNYLKEKPISDPEKSYNLLSELDKDKNAIEWFAPAAFNNTFSLLVKKEKAKELGLESISDLAAYINKNPGTLTFGSNAEFTGRKDDGLDAVEKVYGFEFGAENVKKMETGLPIQALDKEDVDVAVAYSTDGRIKAYDLINLKDDKVFFPAYNGAITTREDILKQHPKLKEELQPIVEKLDDPTITDLNYQVDFKKKSVDEVAKAWLVENKLIKS